MLPGQGTQYHHMGQELFKTHATFRKWMLKLDTICRDLVGESIIAHIYDDTKTKAKPFDRTLFTHPAIFMVEYSMAKTLQEEGVFPDLYIGSSLGEITAAALTKAIDVEEAVRVILKQAQCFEQYCIGSGSMVTILHKSKLYEEIPEIRDNCELVSITFDNHFIVSGCRADIQKVIAYLEKHELLYSKLPVSQGFHSQHINPVEQPFNQFMDTVLISKPDAVMISCMLGRRLGTIDPNHFWKIVRNPIKFRESIFDLEKEKASIYIDIGPSGTFATFLKYMLPDTSQSEKFSILTPFGNDLKRLSRVTENIGANARPSLN